MLTGFIIIILLVSILLVTEQESDIGGMQGTSIDLETRSDPVYRYVTECLRMTSKDAIKQMGEHGGFTDMTRHGFTYDAVEPTEANAVALSIGAGANSSSDAYLIPYYWHMASKSGCNNNCQFELFFAEL
jgi:hypothetical protein